MWLPFLFGLKSCILNGIVMLDMDALSLDQISDLMLEGMANSSQLQGGMHEKVKEALLCWHRHQYEKCHGGDKSSRFPLIRSLAEIGRNSSKSMFGSNTSNGLHFLSLAYYLCIMTSGRKKEKKMYQWFDVQYHNWVMLNANFSMWQVWHGAQYFIFSIVKHIQE